MSDQFDERTDELLRRHFAEQLDGQVGAAAERFRRHISSAAGAGAGKSNGAAPLRMDGSRPIKNNRSRDDAGPRFGSLWAIGIIGGALAAAVTLVSLRHIIMPTKSGPTHSQVADPRGPKRNRDVIPDGGPIDVQQASMDVAVRTVDQGLVPLEDGTPARRLLQQRTDTLKWYDPKRKAQIEYTAPPREQTVYVGYHAH
jgi:hypothetical protein